MQLQQSTEDEKKHGGSPAAEIYRSRCSATPLWSTSTVCAAVKQCHLQATFMKMFTTGRKLASCVPDPETTVHDTRPPTTSVISKELSLGQPWASQRLCGGGLAETSSAPSLLRDKRGLLPLGDCRTGSDDHPHKHMCPQFLFSEFFFFPRMFSLPCIALCFSLSFLFSVNCPFSPSDFPNPPPAHISVKEVTLRASSHVPSLQHLVIARSLRFEPVHPASAQADLCWGSICASHSEGNAETQLINRPAVLLLGIFNCSDTIWGNVSVSKPTCCLTL